MTLSNSQSSSGNSDVLIHRTGSNSRNYGSTGGGIRRNNVDRGHNSKSNNSQYHNKTTDDSERNSRSLSSTMPLASTYSYSNSDISSIEQISTTDHGKSKDSNLDDRTFKNTSEGVDPSILSRGTPTSIRRYTRSALYLLRNDTRSRCRPKCASKLQLLCIWKTNNNSYSNCNQQNGSNTNNSSNLSSTMEMPTSSPRMSSMTRQQSNHDLQCSGNSGNSGSQHSNQKNYLDHRSISSSHLMPAFAKRRIGNPAQLNSANSNVGSSSSTTSNDSLKLQANVKNNDHNQFVSPQRKNVTSSQSTKAIHLNSVNSLDGDNEREQDRERGRERDANLNSSCSSSSNARERRIGSGRLLPRDVDWDYRSEKDSAASSGTIPFEKDLSSHSSITANNTQRVSSNTVLNQNSSNPRFDYAPTSKERNSTAGGKNSSDYRTESRYESRRSYARGEYERDNRGDNSNYVRRFMSDLINQNSGNSQKNSGSASGVGGCGQNPNENRRRNHRNDEPEWFSSGPTSQHDTIELRGFDEVEDSNSNSSSNGIGEVKLNKNSGSKQGPKKNKADTSQINIRHDTHVNEKISNKKIGDSDKQDVSAVHDDDVNKATVESSSSINSSTPPLKVTEYFKSDTNNNNNHSSGYNENEPSLNELSSTVVDTEKQTGDAKNILDNDTINDSSDATVTISNNETEDKATGFNFDVFLNVDPLNNLLMGEQNTRENEVGSRFSRWFVKQGDNIKICEEGLNPQLTEEMVSLMNESKIMKHDRRVPNTTESTNTNQSNTLMEFLQRGKINAVANNTEPISNAVGSIPSVEELEARMRKIGEENTATNREQPVSNTSDNMNNPLNQFLTNSVHYHQQQQQKQLQHFIIKNENNHAVPIQNMLSAGPQLQQHVQINHSHHTGHLAPSQTQDMEAFKKLLEQITPTNAVKLPQNPIQQLAPPQQPHMHRLPPLPQPINILTTIGNMPPPTTQHIMKNDELTKFIQQQQLHQRRQPHAMSGQQHSQMNQSAQNEMPIVQAMFLAPQQRFEAQLLLQGLSRGEVTQSTLGQQLNNPNTSPRTKEVLAAVLRETSRDTSPNVILPPAQIMSPVLGQSHCAPNIPPPPPPILIPSPQQIPINHPSQPGAQQPLPPNGTNPGGLPQRIPSPRELQYHTQSIMQNALIKKKLEEQQENFRRRQEIQKQQQQMQNKSLQSPSHPEINEFGILVGTQAQSYSSNQQHQKKPVQQQPQIIQNQQQQRHVNSPTPLAFTPTSVLRKMTAEKDSVSSFHTSSSIAITTAVTGATANTTPLIATSSMVAANVGTNNVNPSKPMHSVLMHYQQQQQQQTNSSQNQPRMILGVGSHSQQQQPSVAIIAGPPLTQQHPENTRLNQTLRNNQIKWSGAIMNQISITKPMGRPILKGSLTQSIPPSTNATINPIHQQQTQPISQPPQMTFASKIEFQQIQQQRVTSNQQPQSQPQKQQQTQLQSMPPTQQSQNILMTQLYQQQQRAALQRAQQYQLHQLHQQQQQQMTIIQSNGNRPGPVDRIGSNVNTNQPVSNCSNIINYQRDGGLSPTSNQLARWFSPELLAQASAGKLPPLNMNQALSLEEFEKSIQHSSTAVNN